MTFYNCSYLFHVFSFHRTWHTCPHTPHQPSPLTNPYINTSHSTLLNPCTHLHTPHTTSVITFLSPLVTHISCLTHPLTHNWIFIVQYCSGWCWQHSLWYTNAQSWYLQSHVAPSFPMPGHCGLWVNSTVGTKIEQFPRTLPLLSRISRKPVLANKYYVKRFNAQISTTY